MITDVLVICVGNICRSPMAQAVLADRLPGVTVKSAGVDALVGRAADDMAIQLMRARGLDLSGHRAQQISEELCQQANIILVMEQAFRTYVERQFPLSRGKVFRFGEFSKLDIPDPYRQGPQAFEYALSLIDEGIDAWVPRMIKLNHRTPLTEE